jgi:hypothetical protein
MFKVGDLCVGQNAEFDFKRNGMECVVVGGLARRTYRDRMGRRTVALTYMVEWVDSAVTWALPYQIRLRRPPQSDREQLGKWELCPWRPERAAICSAPNRDSSLLSHGGNSSSQDRRAFDQHRV